MKKKELYNFFVYSIGLIIIFFALTPNSLFAQTEVMIEVKIVKFGYDEIRYKGKMKPVWKFYGGDINKGAKELTNYKGETCFTIKTKKNNKAKELDDDKQELRKFLGHTPAFIMTMEAYINSKGGEKCKSDPKDKDRSVTVQDFKLDNLPLDEWSDEITIKDNFSRFWSVFKFKYSLVKGIGDIEASSKETVNDVNKTIEFSLPISLSNKKDLPFIWTYSRDNINWVIIPNSRKEKYSIEFNPLNTLFDGSLSSKTDLMFRANVDINGALKESEILTMSFTPAPPSYDEKDKQIFQSCINIPNGGITINNLRSASKEIKYVLRKAEEGNIPCNLQNPTGENCPGLIKNGSASGGRIEIKELPVGDYVLHIFNADWESGNINNQTSFHIGESVEVKIKENSNKHPTCSNEKGGEINITAEGGKDLWQIVIIPKKGDLFRDGDNILFRNLEEGKYTVYLTDQCGKEEKSNYWLKLPKKISIENIKTLQNKDGFFAEVIIKNGSGNYAVSVIDADLNETNSEVISEINIPISKVGTYKIQVTDKEKPGCPSVEKTIKVEKSPNPKTAKFKIKAVD